MALWRPNLFLASVRYFSLIFMILSPFAQSLSFVEKQMLDRLLTYYDWKVRPSDKRNYILNKADSFPMNVNLTATFLYLQVTEETLQVEMEFIESWYDSRLASNDRVRETFQLPSDVKLWTPQIQMTNRKSSHRCDQETTFWSTGAKITSYCRLTAEVTCNYDPSKFPFHVHRCPILLSSATDNSAVSYLCNHCIKTEHVGLPLNYKLRWYIRRNDTGFNLEVWNLFWNALDKDSTSTNVELKNKLSEIAEMRQYAEQSNRFHLNLCDFFFFGAFLIFAGSVLGIAYQTLELELMLYHSPTLLYLCLIFIPTSVFVILSWITVFTHRKSTKSAVQSASLFGVCILWSKIKSSSVLAVMDIWMLVCLLFISVCIIESILVVLIPVDLPITIHRNENSIHRSLNDVRSSSLIVGQKKKKRSQCCKIRLRKIFNRRTVHKCFCIVYPILFIVFCFVYWKYIVNL